MKYDFAGLPVRIREARESAKMSREYLGKLVGNRSRQAVARWEQPYDRERNSVPDLETISDIAEALRLDFLWLLTGKRFAPDTEGTCGVLIPVFELSSFHDSKKTPLYYRRTLADVEEGGEGFRVADLSNAPEYMPADNVITEPCGEPQPGRMMVARLIEKRMNVFAECVISGYGVGGKPVFDLVPMNKAFPTISSKAEPIELLAVAVEHQRDLRNR